MKPKRRGGGGALPTAHGLLRVTKSSNGVLVDVEIQHLNRSIKFDEDPSQAAWFAISTDAIPAFREFLFREDSAKFSSGSTRVCSSDCRSFVCLRQNRWTGLRYSVLMARLSNGQLRAISFNDRRSSRSRSGGDEELVKKAVLFSRSVLFRDWREQVEAKRGDKVDCRCGKSRNRGQLVACDLCGAREHLECLGYSQIPSDYLCPACLRAQKEEVIVIRMDEQEEGRLINSGDSWAPDSRTRDSSVCCLCGCEDNEDYETMIQACTCEGAAVSAHPTCETLAKECLAQKKATSTCHACGTPKPATLKRSTRRPLSSDITAPKGLKRLRSALSHGAKSEVDEQREKEKEKMVDKQPGLGLLGRRFSDAASTVPIKKRRIQTVRSPSPPSRSPSPKVKTNMQQEIEDIQYGKTNGGQGKEFYDERLPKCTQNKVEEEEEAHYDTSKDEDFERSEHEDSAIPSNEDGSGKSTKDSDRSHWDLNMYMDAWERPCAGANSAEPELPGSTDEARTKEQEEGLQQRNAVTEIDTPNQLANEADAKEESALVTVVSESLDRSSLPNGVLDPSVVEPEVAMPTDGDNVTTEVVMDRSNGQTNTEDAGATATMSVTDGTNNCEDAGGTNDCEDAAARGGTEVEVFTEYETFEEEEEPDADAPERAKPVEDEKVDEGEEGQITTAEWAGQGEETEAENVDYGDSDEEAPEDRNAQVEEYEGEQGEIHEPYPKQEADTKRDIEAVDIRKEGSSEAAVEEKDGGSKVQRRKYSGWDQLPEGFESAEEALRASKELFRRNRPNAWGGSRSIRPAGPRMPHFEGGYDRFRQDESSWGRHDHHDHRDIYDTDTRFYSRDFGRGRSRGGPSVPRRGELWMNGSTVPPQGQWSGPKHHLSSPSVGFGANAAAVAAAKVESSGFIVAPDGTITKAGSPGAAVRGGSRQFPGRNPPPIMMNPGGNVSEPMPPGRGIGLSPGMRVTPGMGVVGMTPGLRRHPYEPPGKWSRRSSRLRSRSRSSSPRKGRYSRSPGYVKGKEISPPKVPLPPAPPRGQRSPPMGLRRRDGRFFDDYEREPRTSGWDLGPGDVGRVVMGRFDDVDRRLRRDKSGFSSLRHLGGGRDVEDEVAPRRRRPPS